MRISRRNLVLSLGLVTALGLLVAPAGASGNSGDVKIHVSGDVGRQNNDAHVGCEFFVEGFNMDADSGTIVFKAWSPTGEMDVVHATGAAETWTADADGNFVSGPFSLPDTHTHVQGTHYKAFVTDTKHDKMKVFWLKCDTESSGCETDCQPPCTTDCAPCVTDCNPPPECETDCIPPTTEVPFFPSVASLGLALVGAGGAVALAMTNVRRRG
jgi:hypothetical protein